MNWTKLEISNSAAGRGANNIPPKQVGHLRDVNDVRPQATMNTAGKANRQAKKSHGHATQYGGYKRNSFAGIKATSGVKHK